MTFVHQQAARLDEQSVIIKEQAVRLERQTNNIEKQSKVIEQLRKENQVSINRIFFINEELFHISGYKHPVQFGY